MSESAAIFKLFLVSWLRKTAPANTLQATGAEDKALLGSNLSADSGAKTRLGFGAKPSLSREVDSTGIGISAKNPRGVGTESPTKTPPLLRTHFVGSIHSQLPLFRRTHVSALNICTSLFRRSGVAIIIQPRGLAA